MFNEEHHGTFSSFSAVHFVTVGALLVLSSGFIKVSKWTSGNESKDAILRYCLAGFLFFMELTYNVWIINKDGFSIASLPLHLCDVINFLTIAALLFNSEKIAGIVYYWALLSTPLALISPTLMYGPLHFRFYHYFLLHLVQVLGNLHFLLTHRVSVSSLINVKSIIILTILSSAMLVVDLISGQNWFYMAESPVKSISDSLGFPLYTIAWMGFNTLLLRFWYFITKVCVR